MIRDYSVYEMNKKEKVVFFSCGYMCIAIVAYLFYHNIILSIIAGGAVLWLQPLYEHFAAAKRMKELNVQFKDLLYSLSASISAGRQMSDAIVEASDNLAIMYDTDQPIMAELSHMRRSIIENNESEAVLMSDFAKRSHSEDISNFVQVYLTCRDTGGDMNEIITRTSDIITEKMSIQREIQTITAQKKLEGRMIALMPLVMLLLLNLVSPSYIAVLYETLAGRLIMTAALGGLILGIWLMEKISNIEV